MTSHLLHGLSLLSGAAFVLSAHRIRVFNSCFLSALGLRLFFSLRKAFVVFKPVTDCWSWVCYTQPFPAVHEGEGGLGHCRMREGRGAGKPETLPFVVIKNSPHAASVVSYRPGKGCFYSSLLSVSGTSPKLSTEQSKQCPLLQPAPPDLSSVLLFRKRIKNSNSVKSASPFNL